MIEVTTTRDIDAARAEADRLRCRGVRTAEGRVPYSTLGDKWEPGWWRLTELDDGVCLFEQFADSGERGMVGTVEPESWEQALSVVRRIVSENERRARS